MKIIEHIALSECKLVLTKSDKTTLKRDLQLYFVGKDHVCVQVGYIQYTYRPTDPLYMKYARETGGKLIPSEYPTSTMWDIFLAHLYAPDEKFLGNIFIFAGERDFYLNAGTHGLEIDDKETEELENRIQNLRNEPENKTFEQRQLRWIKEEPWTKIYGLTPEEAVLKLEELGW